MSARFTRSVSPARPNWVNSVTDDAARRVEPFELAGDPAAALARLADVVAAETLAKVIERTESSLRSAFTSPFFRFVDDVEFVLGDGVIHVQSASRLGYSDLGCNRRRVERLREKWAAANEAHRQAAGVIE